MRKSTWLAGAVVVCAGLICARAEAAPITLYSGHGIDPATALVARTLTLFEVSNFSLRSLADDTAIVQLVGAGGSVTTLFNALTGQTNPCSPGGNGPAAFGCMQANLGVSTLRNLAAGLYTIHIYSFQPRSDVTGPPDEDTVPGTQNGDTITPVAEPGTLVLLGIAVVGLVARRRRQVATRPLSC